MKPLGFSSSMLSLMRSGAAPRKETLDRIRGLALTLESMQTSDIKKVILIHKMMDEKCAEIDVPYTCRAGCSNCCSIHVDIYPPEADLLIGHVIETGMDIDIERLERQAKVSADDWHTQPEADRRCVFLGDDGLCRVYEHRPSGCRKYYVNSDPALCNDHTKIVSVVSSPAAELLDSAAITAFSGGSMPGQLLKVLRRLGATE